MADPASPAVLCHCNAIRQGARQVTQFYDRHLAPAGLRTSQYAMLVGLRRLGPISINAFAEAMAMDRTTMGRGLKPLERDGLLAVGDGRLRGFGPEERDGRLGSGLGWIGRLGRLEREALELAEERVGRRVGG